MNISVVNNVQSRTPSCFTVNNLYNVNKIQEGIYYQTVILFSLPYSSFKICQLLNTVFSKAYSQVFSTFTAGCLRKKLSKQRLIMRIYRSFLTVIIKANQVKYKKIQKRMIMQ
jgi:hypothetical protein